jgi:hypothetical protein
LAEAQLKSILAKEPDNLVVLNQWGIMGVRRKNFAQAIQAFARVVELEPSNHLVRKNLVLALLSSDQPGVAIKHLEILLSANQNDFQLWALLSQGQKALGDLSAAQESAIKSLTINPNQPGLKAWVDSLAPKPRPRPTPPPPPTPSAHKPKVNLLSFLCSQGQDEEIDLLGERLDRAITVKKILSLGEEPYLAALSGRGAIWVEGLSPRSANWLSRLTPSSRPVILRIGPADLALESSVFNLGAVSVVFAETKAIMEVFLARGAKLKEGAKLLVAPRVAPLERITPKALTDNPPLSLAYLGSWEEPGLVLEALLLARRKDNRATLWALERPKNTSVARFVDQNLAKNGLAGAALFATPSLSRSEFYAGRTHLLTTWTMAGGSEAWKALAHGLMPVVRDGLGAGELFPADRLWANLADLERLLEGLDNEASVAWAQKIGSVEPLVDRVLGVL